MNQVVAFVFFTQISITVPQDIVFRDESYGSDVGCPCMNQFGNGLCVFPGNCRIPLKDMHNGYPPICFFHQHRIPVICCPVDKVISFWPVNSLWGETTTGGFPAMPAVTPPAYPAPVQPPMYPSNFPPPPNVETPITTGDGKPLPGSVPPMPSEDPKLPSIPSIPSAPSASIPPSIPIAPSVPIPPSVPIAPNVPIPPSVPSDDGLSGFPNLPSEPPNSLADLPQTTNDFLNNSPAGSTVSPASSTSFSDSPTFPINFTSILENEQTTLSSISPVSSEVPNLIDGAPLTEKVPPLLENFPNLSTPIELDDTLSDDSLSNDLPNITKEEGTTIPDKPASDDTPDIEVTTHRGPWLIENLDNIPLEEIIIKNPSTTSTPNISEESSSVSSNDIPSSPSAIPNLDEEVVTSTERRPSLWDDILNIPTEEIIIRGPSTSTAAPSTSDQSSSSDISPIPDEKKPVATDQSPPDLNIGEIFTPSTERNPLWDNILNIPTEEIIIKSTSSPVSASSSSPDISNESTTSSPSSSISPNDVSSSTDIPLCINYIEQINVRFGEDETTPEYNPKSRKPLCFSPINTNNDSAGDDLDDDIPDIPVRSDRLSTAKCKEYSQNYTTNNDNTASEDSPATAPGEFPHMAAIGVDESDYDDGSLYFICGGTLISERFVLTAAQCFTTNSPDVVRLGAFDLTDGSGDGKTAKDFGIERVFIYPRYSSKSIYHNIALIKLDADVEFGRYIRPACLNNHPDSSGMGLATTGWGHTSFGGSEYNTLQKVPLTIVPRKACSEHYPREKPVSDGVIKSLVCAESNSAGKSPCQGDSGGPLAFYSYDSSISANIYYIVGITAHGKECGTRIPALYTRVYSYLDWIEEIAFN